MHCGLQDWGLPLSPWHRYGKQWKLFWKQRKSYLPGISPCGVSPERDPSPVPTKINGKDPVISVSYGSALLGKKKPSPLTRLLPCPVHRSSQQNQGAWLDRTAQHPLPTALALPCVYWGQASRQKWGLVPMICQSMGKGTAPYATQTNNPAGFSQQIQHLGSR